MTNNKKDPAMVVSVVSIVINVVLSLFKFLAGVIAHSGAMISDAVHSASDVLSTIMVIIGIKISGKESDKGHQYGHERFECIASIVLSVILCLTGIAIGWSGLKKVISGNYDALEVPGTLALIAAIVSIAVKEWMYHYTKRTAKKLGSTSLMADAWHHRSDGFSSIGSFIGIGGAMLGFKVLDPIASVVICVLIVKASVDIFNDTMGQMVDKACDEDLVQKITDVILNCDGVISIDDLKTRMFGAKIYVDVEISANGQITLYEAHDIAQNVHDNIEHAFLQVKHCMVHVNPR